MRDSLLEYFEKHLLPEQLQDFESLAPQQKVDFILDKTSFTQEKLAKKIAELSGNAYIDEIHPQDHPEKLLDSRIILEYQCLPLNDNDGFVLAVSYPLSEEQTAWIAAICGKTPVFKIAQNKKLAETISQRFGVGADSFAQGEGDILSDADDADFEEDENAAIIKFVNEIVLKAVLDRATDIHIEPQKESLNIRFRIDGNLVPVKLPDNLVKFKNAVISRIKIMAKLNISEKRRPQDGRIKFTAKNGTDIDIRVSSLPTLYGESISLRLLTQKSHAVTIDDLGFMPEDLAKISDPLSRPHGIILVTGPTGSGKSTTLTAFIRKLRRPQVRIITVEDPVEYEVGNVNQTQVQPEIGLTFSAALRSILRQDPDIIMIGEIRDRETADIAIRASLTGHLVLSTLHTNDAAGALTRLLDMDIEPFLIASSVEMILAQRLVRKLCTCKTKANYTKEYLKDCATSLSISDKMLENCEGICMPVGCKKCGNIGYFGRTGIFEILLTNERLHNMVITRKTARQIRNDAREHGMRTLQECGFELLKRGITGLEEIMAYAGENE